MLSQDYFTCGVPAEDSRLPNLIRAACLTHYRMAASKPTFRATVLLQADVSFPKHLPARLIFKERYRLPLVHTLSRFRSVTVCGAY